METENNAGNVPYIVYESVIIRDERIIRRLWIALLAAIAAIFLLNGCWLLYLSQYDFSDETITVDSQDGGNASYIARDGVSTMAIIKRRRRKRTRKDKKSKGTATKTTVIVNGETVNQNEDFKTGQSQPSEKTVQPGNSGAH